MNFKTVPGNTPFLQSKQLAYEKDCRTHDSFESLDPIFDSFDYVLYGLHDECYDKSIPPSYSLQSTTDSAQLQDTFLASNSTRCDQHFYKESSSSSVNKRQKIVYPTTTNDFANVYAFETLSPDKSLKDDSFHSMKNTTKNLVNAPIVSDEMWYKTRTEIIEMGDASGRSRTVKNGNWHKEEDELLCKAVNLVSNKKVYNFGRMPWSLICHSVPGRSSKQCRERFVEHLDKSLCNDNKLIEEERDYVNYLFGKHGRSWSKICDDLNIWRKQKGHVGVRACQFVKNYLTRQHVFEFEEHLREDTHSSNHNFGLESHTNTTTNESVSIVTSNPSNDTIDLHAFFDVFELEEGTVTMNDWKHKIHGARRGSPVVFNDTNDNTIGGYHEVVKERPLQFYTGRKKQVLLSTGNETTSRSLFREINKMINSNYTTPNI